MKLCLGLLGPASSSWCHGEGVKGRRFGGVVGRACYEVGLGGTFRSAEAPLVCSRRPTGYLGDTLPLADHTPDRPPGDSDDDTPLRNEAVRGHRSNSRKGSGAFTYGATDTISTPVTTAEPRAGPDVTGSRRGIIHDDFFPTPDIHRAADS